MEELWASDLDMVTTVDPAYTDAQNGIKECGRRLEIFLDLITCHTASLHVHVMERRFDAVLSDSERLFRDQLISFTRNLPPAAKQSSVYPFIYIKFNFIILLYKKKKFF